MKKQNPLSLIRVIMILFSFVFSSSIMAQKIDPGTLNIDELNLYKEKAVKLRNAGMIVTFSGLGIVAAGYLSSIIWARNFKGESGEELITVAPFFIGMAVGLPAALVGFTLSAVGASRKAKAEVGLKRFETIQKNSMALGVGLTIRF